MIEERINNINNRLATIAPLTNEEIGFIPSLQTNPLPEYSEMLSKVLQLYTKDVTDPSNPIIIDETFEIVPGNFSLVKLDNSGANRWIYAFGSSGYGMKFHFPYGINKNKIYITFCERNAGYYDGWKDYVTSVTAEWVNAAVSFFNKMPLSLSPAGTTRDFSSEVFNNYNQFVLWANFKGIGPSSVAEGSQGTVRFSMQFVNEQATIEAGGAVSAVGV